MSESNDYPQDTPITESKSLICPSCEKLWHLCLCATRKVDLSDLPLSKKQVDSEKDSIKGRIIANRYEIIDDLGEGGSSSVYLCEHLALKKKLALKILHKNLLENQTAINRLQREAQACANLSHPNIVSVYDFGITDNGFPYLVMDFLDGVAMHSLGKLNASRTIALALDICKGLKTAHEAGIIHRDLKPNNIIVTRPDTPEEKAIIVDFGIAKTELPGGEMQHLTQTGEVLGSPAYMSPEQISGKPVDERSDIYSMGCILYEAVTGQQLFRGYTYIATLHANLNDAVPELPAEAVKNDPKLASLEKILLQCLAKEKENRFASVEELENALEYIAGKKLNNRKSPLILVLTTVFLTSISLFGLVAIVKPGSGLKTQKSYQSEILPAFISETTEYSERAQEQYKFAFKNGSSTNIKLLGAQGYIRCLGDEFASLDESFFPRIIRELMNAKKDVGNLIAVSKAYKEAFNPRLAAMVFFTHKTSLDNVRQGMVHSTIGDQSNFAGFTMVARSACKRNKTLKDLYQDASSSMEIAIRLMTEGIKEPTDDDKLQLALYTGYLGECLLVLGHDKKAIESFEKAIRILEESKTKYFSHLAWWHCDLGKAYLITGDLSKAENQKNIALKISQIQLDKEVNNSLSTFIEELEFYKKQKKSD